MQLHWQFAQALQAVHRCPRVANTHTADAWSVHSAFLNVPTETMMVAALRGTAGISSTRLASIDMIQQEERREERPGGLSPNGDEQGRPGSAIHHRYQPTATAIERL